MKYFSTLFILLIFSLRAWGGLTQAQIESLDVIIDKDTNVKNLYEGSCSQDNFANQNDLDGDPYESRAHCLIGLMGEAKLKELSEKYLVKKEDKSTIENIGNIKSKQNKAVENLENYLKDKLRKALYGSIPAGSDKKENIVDQEVFYELYESQVGKNVIGSLSAYCIETKIQIVPANPPTQPKPILSTDFIISEDSETRKTNRQKNIELLTSNDKFADEKGNNVNTAYKAWGDCITDIQYICSKKQATLPDGTKTGVNYESKTISDYARGRACNTTEYVKAMRQNLIAVVQLQKEYKKRLPKGAMEIAESDVKGNAIVRDVTQYDTQQVDELTTLTSNEFVNKSGYKKGNEEMVKDFEKKCEITNDEGECAKYMNYKDGKDKLNKLADELELKKRMLEEKIKTMDKEEKEKFLASQGFTNDQISAIINADESLSKMLIVNHYKAEREGIIAGIKDRINKTSIAGDSYDEAVDKPGVVAFIKKEMEEKVDRYKEIIHFNNVISGYLKIGGDDGKRNLATMHREIEDSAFDPRNDPDAGGRRTASGGAAGASTSTTFDQLREQVEQEKESEVKAGEGTLGVSEINENIIKYIEPTPKPTP